MAAFNYESEMFSGTTPESVNTDLITWVNSRQGEIEIVSSNIIVYQNPDKDNELTFTIYSLYIKFNGK